MPKMKTHRGAAKRFKRTGGGKFLRSRQGRRHILTKKDPKRKRQLRRKALVDPADEPRIKQLLPYL